MTCEPLPAPDARMTPNRKAQIVDAVENGRLSLDDALRLYSLSIEEFTRWTVLCERFGVKGLRLSKAQRYTREIAA
jgi:hypothetical protein